MKKLIGDFGSGAYVVSRSLSPDYVICNVPCFLEFSKKQQELEQYIQCRIEAEVDAYNGMPRYLDLAEAEESGMIEYMSVSKEFVEKQMEGGKKTYYLQDYEEIIRLVDDMINKLEGYAEIELL